jgi:hypothetical protein
VSVHVPACSANPKDCGIDVVQADRRFYITAISRLSKQSKQVIQATTHRMVTPAASLVCTVQHGTRFAVRYVEMSKHGWAFLLNVLDPVLHSMLKDRHPKSTCTCAVNSVDAALSQSQRSGLREQAKQVQNKSNRSDSRGIGAQPASPDPSLRSRCYQQRFDAGSCLTVRYVASASSKAVPRMIQ